MQLTTWGWPLRTNRDPSQQSARKRGPLSHNSRKLNSANNLTELGRGHELQLRLQLWSIPSLQPLKLWTEAAQQTHVSLLSSGNHKIINGYCVQVVIWSSNRIPKHQLIFIPCTDAVRGNLIWLWPHITPRLIIEIEWLILNCPNPCSLKSPCLFTCHSWMNSYSNFKTQVKCCFFKEAFPYRQPNPLPSRINYYSLLPQQQLSVHLQNTCHDVSW